MFVGTSRLIIAPIRFLRQLNRDAMATGKRIFAAVAGWAALVTGAHLALNVDWSVALNDRQPRDQRKFYVAYIPVT